MTARLPYDGGTVFAWDHRGLLVRGSVVASIALTKGSRAVLRDGDDCYWLAAIDDDGRLDQVVAGPVTVADALTAAEQVVAGVHHGSAASASMSMAIAMAATVAGAGLTPEVLA